MVGLLSFSNKDGAGASVFSATAKEVVENGIRGEYIKPIVGWNLGFGGVRIGKVDEMKDPEAGAKLWEACEKTVYGNDSTA